MADIVFKSDKEGKLLEFMFEKLADRSRTDVSEEWKREVERSIKNREAWERFIESDSV